MIIFAVADFNSKPKSTGNTLVAIQMSVLWILSFTAQSRRNLPSKTAYIQSSNKNKDRSNPFPLASKSEPG